MPLTATSGGLDIPDGVYPATILGVQETPPTPKSPNNEPFLTWTIHVYHSSEGVELSAFSSKSFKPKSKARTWVESVLDKRFQEGEQWEYEHFGPHDCQVKIAKDKNGYSAIEAVMGVPKRPGQKPLGGIQV